MSKLDSMRVREETGVDWVAYRTLTRRDSRYGNRCGARESVLRAWRTRAGMVG